MSRIERKYLAHYLLVGGEYVLLGRDLQVFAPEMKARVEKHRNILGTTSVCISGYEKQARVEPYFAELGDPLFGFLQDILDREAVLDALQVQVVEVRLWEQNADGSFPAVRETAYLEVSRYGGDCQGYQIPFTLHYTGHRAPGSFDPKGKVFRQGL